MIRSRPYIFWLQENTSEPTRDTEQEVGPYESHRRLVAFDVNTDQSALAGYSWRNPLTNHNYGYQLRVDIKMLDNSDLNYRLAAWAGVVYILVSGLYLWNRGGWTLALLPLGLGALATELISLKATRDFDKLAPTFQKCAEYIQKQYQEGKPQYVELVNKWHYGDVEYAAGRLWQANHVDKLGQMQGSSIVSSAGGGACFHRLVFDGGFKQSWWMIILGVLGSLSTVDNLLTWIQVGSSLQDGGEVVGHLYHLIGQLTGVFASWFVKRQYKI